MDIDFVAVTHTMESVLSIPNLKKRLRASLSSARHRAWLKNGSAQCLLQLIRLYGQNGQYRNALLCLTPWRADDEQALRKR